MLKIDRETYKISENNFNKKETEKNLIIIGDTSRKNSNHLNRMMYKDFGLNKSWNTYTISREGNVYEHYDPKYFSDFTSKPSINNRCISILFENMGYIYHDEGKYYNWINEECEDISKLFRKHWKFGYFWEKYTEEQYESFVDLIVYLIKKYEIPNNIIATNLYEEFSHEYKGIISRSNLNKNEIDVNPSFDYDKVIKMISKEIEINED